MGENNLQKSREQTLNFLAEQYITKQNADTLDALIRAFDQEYRPKYEWIATQQVRNYDVQEVQSEYEDTLLKVIEAYVPGNNFTKLLDVSLKRKRIDMAEKQKTRKKHTQSFHVFEDGSSTEKNLSMDKHKEEKKKEKKEARVELINFFMEHTQDAETKKILQEASKFKNMNQLALHLNMHPQTLKRKLESLKKIYDERRFGNYKEFL
jgi:DNA-directed RNA polymerase specialized sigma24 family protein